MSSHRIRPLLSLLSLLSVFVAVGLNAEQPGVSDQDVWRAANTTNAPTARYNHTAIWTGTKMIVWGGIFTGPGIRVTNTGGQYDPVTDSWTAIATAGAPTARSVHTAVWTGTRMIVWGGFDGTSVLNTGGQYDPVTDSWTATATAGAPIGRGFYTSVWTGRKMIVWGGATGHLPFEGVPPTTNTGGQYDPAGNTWTATAAMGAPVPRWLHTAVWTGSKMVVWGGVNNNLGATNTGGRYDPVTDFWMATTTAGAPIGGAATAVWTGTKMIVWGDSNTGGQWSPSSGLCTSAPDTLCLNANRFAVQVRWRVPSQGTNGPGIAMPMTGDTGSFWFFTANNVELVVKVLDGRAFNGRFWVFYGALSNVEYTITVTDTVTEAVRTYSNPSGTQASIADTSAF